MSSYGLGPAERDDYDYQYGEYGPPRRRYLRGLVLALVAAAVMTAFGGGLWYAYRQLSGHGAGGEVPLIRADGRETKMRPEQPGGMVIPNMDKTIYDRGKDQPQIERLLPPPEAPMPRPVAPPEPPAPAAEAAAPPQAATPPAASPTPPVEPPAASTPANNPAAVPPSDATPAARAATAPRPPNPAAPPTSAQPQTAGKSGYRLQVASVRNEQTARQEWDRLRRAHKDLLGSLGETTARTDLGARGIYYRVQAGPIADAAAAERICNELKRRNVGCILVRP
jgi:sporulation related protein